MCVLILVFFCKPAIKLVEFFRGMARNDELAQTQGSLGETGGTPEFSTAKSQLVSKTLAQMRSVGEIEAYSWVKYWNAKGFFE